MSPARSLSCWNQALRRADATTWTVISIQKTIGRDLSSLDELARHTAPHRTRTARPPQHDAEACTLATPDDQERLAASPQPHRMIRGNVRPVRWLERAAKAEERLEDIMTASILVGYSPRRRRSGTGQFSASPPAVSPERRLWSPPSIRVARVDRMSEEFGGEAAGAGGTLEQLRGGVGPGRSRRDHPRRRAELAGAAAQAVELHPGLLVIGSAHRGGLGRLLPGARQSA